jgi:serine/threonine protein kinase/tetratricopeptide (TPR) repeat protein
VSEGTLVIIDTVSPDQWQKLEQVFEAVMDLPAEEQKVYLDAACADDPEVRQELEVMLGSSMEQKFASAIGNAAVQVASEPEVDPLIGNFLGPYRVTELLGRGGMGSVYAAVREDDQFSKKVAIKVISRVLAGADGIARFRAERQILANLEHPNIARMLDGGTSDGIPFLVMEFVEGVPITRYARERNLPIRERLRLMQSVCSAVQYAHGMLVVHRDLKPANILVSTSGVVKLLDFGVAKMMDPSALEADHTSAMMMTPDYASPEQIRGEPVTTATDVYSLGVVMFELLTGERPYRVTGQSPMEMERAICTTEPRRPSELTDLPIRTRRILSGDLDNIVLMALRKDALRRYKSAEQLSVDIQAYLDEMPVHARPDTIWYRTSKFLVRNSWAVAAGAVVAISLVTATAISIRQARAAQHRFDQFRGFARTVLIDVHGQLTDIPGTGRARQALIAHVNDYLKRVVADNSSDDMALAGEIATTYLRLAEIQGATPEAMASYESGMHLLDLKRKNGNASPADLLLLAGLRARLGNLQAELGHVAEGMENLQAASNLAEGLINKPESKLEAAKVYGRANWRLGRIYRTQFKLDLAEERSKRAIQVSENLRSDRELEEILVGARLVLGGVYRRQGKWKESLDLYSSVLEYNKRRAAENPASANLQRELARTHQIMSDMLLVIRSRHSEAKEHVHAAVAIAERLAAPDPLDKQAQSELGQYLSTGAEGLMELHEFKEAEVYLRRAMPIFQRLLEREPDSSVNLLFAALTESELGDLIGQQKMSAQSLDHVRHGFALMKKLMDRDPGNTTNRIEYFKVQRLLALNLARAGHKDESLAVSRDLVDGARDLLKAMGTAELPMREIPRASSLMARVYRELGNREEAQRWYQRASKEWDAWTKLGRTTYLVDEEIAEARKGASQSNDSRLISR